MFLHIAKHFSSEPRSIHPVPLLQNVKDMERVCREIHVLKNIRHPNIIQLYGRHMRCSSIICNLLCMYEAIDRGTHVYMVIEYAAGGELWDYIENHGPIPQVLRCCCVKTVFLFHFSLRVAPKSFSTKCTNRFHAASLHAAPHAAAGAICRRLLPPPKRCAS
jgi:serine/threonine protein kinase